jgi:hypothetical protein
MQEAPGGPEGCHGGIGATPKEEERSSHRSPPSLPPFFYFLLTSFCPSSRAATRRVCGWPGHKMQFLCNRLNHARCDRRGLFSIRTKCGLLNRLPIKVMGF